MRAPRPTVAVLAAVALLAAAGCGGGGTGRHAPASGPPFAPYADVTLEQPFDVASVALHAPVDAVTLGFVTSSGGACRPAWGSLALRNEAVDAAIARVRGSGRAVRVSFGGRAGTDLMRACSDPARLAAAYAQVVDGYAGRALDFDVEGAALRDRRAVTRFARALAMLEGREARAGRQLTVSVSLPVLPSGLTPAGLALLHTAARSGAAIAVVNLLAMDYGRPVAPGGMADAALAAARAAHAQLARLPGRRRAGWRALGLTPMLGRNDVAGETLTLEDARAIAAFARRRGLGLLSLWSLARDRPCPPGTPAATAQPTCSGVGAPPHAYARAMTLELSR